MVYSQKSLAQTQHNTRTHRPCAVPAFSYFDLSLAAVARASDRTESIVEARDENERVVENVDENDDPRPRPSVVRQRRRYIIHRTRLTCPTSRERLNFSLRSRCANPEKRTWFITGQLDELTHRHAIKKIKNLYLNT